MNHGSGDGANPKVDGFFERAKKWQAELRQLRTVILDCGLSETMKWGKPCYTFQANNVVILQGFKNACAILFTKGGLLRDPDGVLEKPGENTQAARRILFTDVREIVAMTSTLKAYLQEAMAVEEAGLKVEFKKPSEFEIPEELQNKMDEMPALKAAFEALTPGRQRAYYLHFAAPKQSKTRVARVEKCIPAILEGKGLNDR